MLAAIWAARVGSSQMWGSLPSSLARSAIPSEQSMVWGAWAMTSAMKSSSPAPESSSTSHRSTASICRTERE